MKTKAASSIVKIECHRYVSDWYKTETVEIDLNEWNYFTVDFRGESDWHLIGHKSENDKWVQKEFSVHGIYRNSLIEFIRAANSHNPYQKCKVSRFNNLHYYGNFYAELAKLLNDVANKKDGKDGL